MVGRTTSRAPKSTPFQVPAALRPQRRLWRRHLPLLLPVQPPGRPCPRPPRPPPLRCGPASSRPSQRCCRRRYPLALPLPQTLPTCSTPQPPAAKRSTGCSTTSPGPTRNGCWTCSSRSDSQPLQTPPAARGNCHCTCRPSRWNCGSGMPWGCCTTRAGPILVGGGGTPIVFMEGTMRIPRSSRHPATTTAPGGASRAPPRPPPPPPPRPPHPTCSWPKSTGRGSTTAAPSPPRWAACCPPPSAGSGWGPTA